MIGLGLTVMVTVPVNARALARGPRTRAGAVHVRGLPSRTPFDCEPAPTTRGGRASAERCLREACAGGNVTNEFTHDRDGRIRRNPCYGRAPFEPERE